jgi:hypothetical protein
VADRGLALSWFYASPAPGAFGANGSCVDRANTIVLPMSV